MNYRQLEEAINKWTIELEEQEKIFLQQATQVNAWDRLLIDNGEKVLILQSEINHHKHCFFRHCDLILRLEHFWSNYYRPRSGEIMYLVASVRPFVCVCSPVRALLSELFDLRP